MFIRWLFTVFPGEMRTGWNLVKPDLAAWVAISTALAAATVAADPIAASERVTISVVLGTPLFLFVLVTMAIKFQAASEDSPVSWGFVCERFVRRALPLMLAALLAVGLSMSVAVVARSAIVILLRDTPLMPLTAALVGLVVYLSLLVRFAFVPYLAVLNRRAEIDVARTPGMRLPLPIPALAWPLLASGRMTQGARWRLAPYVFLLNAGAAAGLLVPAAAQLPFLVIWQLVQLTAQAVLFGYYRELGPRTLSEPGTSASG